jgi:hypothetical protein
MPPATAWWARTDWSSIGTTGISYDWPSGTLSGRVTRRMDQSEPSF